jgi:hypothetical protein
MDRPAAAMRLVVTSTMARLFNARSGRDETWPVRVQGNQAACKKTGDEKVAVGSSRENWPVVPLQIEEAG